MGVHSKALGVLFPMVPYFDVSICHMSEKNAVYCSQVEVPIDAFLHAKVHQNGICPHPPPPPW